MTYEAGNNTMNIINTKMNLTNQSESELTSKNDNIIYDMQHIPERMMTNSNRFEDITSKKNTYESTYKKFRRSFQNVIENSKVISMFIDSNKYDGSAIGLIDEEHSLMDENKGCYTNSQFRSMNDVKEMNQRMIKISMRRFIKCKGVIKIVQFDYDDYDSIVNSHELIRKKIKIEISKQYGYIVKGFKAKYAKYLNVQEWKVKTNKTSYSNNFVLEIQSQILPNKHKDNVSYDISYSYELSNHRTFLEIFKFDVFRDKNFPLWLALESEEYRRKRQRVVYTSSVQKYSFNDSIVIEINLIEQLNGEIRKIEWMTIKEDDAQKEIYEKREIKGEIAYDSMRSCEIETLVHIWKKQNEFIRTNSIVLLVRKVFERHFDVKEIEYDSMKNLYIKIKMKANKCGEIKSAVLNVNISVIDNIEKKINVGCVNALAMQRESFQVRKGTMVLFYIVDSF